MRKMFLLLPATHMETPHIVVTGQPTIPTGTPHTAVMGQNTVPMGIRLTLVDQMDIRVPQILTEILHIIPVVPEIITPQILTEIRRILPAAMEPTEQ